MCLSEVCVSYLDNECGGLFVGQVAFQGTVVTIENFLAWKAQFELEMAEVRRKRQKEEEQAGKTKLTGKPLHTCSCVRDLC